jgi:hypothetical protein
VFLGAQTDNYDPLIRRLLTNAVAPATALPARDGFALVARRQNELSVRLARDVERLTGVTGVQAFCLECPGRPVAPVSRAEGPGGLAALVKLLLAN